TFTPHVACKRGLTSCGRLKLEASRHKTMGRTDGPKSLLEPVWFRSGSYVNASLSTMSWRHYESDSDVGVVHVCHSHFCSPRDYWRLEWNTQCRHDRAAPGSTYQQEA